MISAPCPYCGCRNTRISGGNNGDPFDQQPEKLICEGCGRILWAEPGKEDVLLPEPGTFTPRTLNIQRVLLVEMTAQAMNVCRSAQMHLPYSQGYHSFRGGEYPFGRFSGLTLRDNTVEFDGESYELTRQGIHITRQFTATDYCGAAWPETVDIMIRDTFQTVK